MRKLKLGDVKEPLLGPSTRSVARVWSKQRDSIALLLSTTWKFIKWFQLTHGRMGTLSGQRLSAPGAGCLSTFFLMSYQYGRLKCCREETGRHVNFKLEQRWEASSGSTLARSVVHVARCAPSPGKAPAPVPDQRPPSGCLQVTPIPQGFRDHYYRREGDRPCLFWCFLLSWESEQQPLCWAPVLSSHAFGPAERMTLWLEATLAHGFHHHGRLSGPGPGWLYSQVNQETPWPLCLLFSLPETFSS